MEESEAYNHGQYETYEEALKAAQKIVIEYFDENWERGMKPDALKASYTMYGKDPIILCNEPGDIPTFSAWDYARRIVNEYCKKRRN